MKRKQQERGAAALEPAAKQSKSPSLSSSLEALSNSASAAVTCGVPLVLSPRPCRKEHPGFPAASDASGAEICARAVESAELAGEMTERDVIPVPTVPAPDVVQSVQISRMSPVRPVASSRGHYSKTEQIYAFFRETSPLSYNCLLWSSTPTHRSAVRGPVGNLEYHLRNFHHAALKTMEDAYQAGKVLKEAADAIFAANVEEKAKAEKQVKGMRNILEKSLQKGMDCVGAAVFFGCWSAKKSISYNSFSDDLWFEGMACLNVGKQALCGRDGMSGPVRDLLYKMALKEQQVLLKTVKLYSITTDGWTDATGAHMATLTVHWIDESFCHKSTVACVRYLAAQNSDAIVHFLNRSSKKSCLLEFSARSFKTTRRCARRLDES